MSGSRAAAGWIAFEDVARCRLCTGPPAHLFASNDFVLPLCASCACRWVHPDGPSLWAPDEHRVPCPTCDAPPLDPAPAAVDRAPSLP